jgi:hypothetical protein
MCGWSTKTALLFLAALFCMAGSTGVRPRASATDYPAHQSTAGFAIGAALIPRADVKKIFAADLNSGGYVVIEVGVFPSQGKDVDLSPADFMLLTDSGRVAARPVDADAIAAALGRQHEYSPPKQTDVYTSTGVTIDRVPAIDPATGRQTNRTVIGTREGVGVGAPPVDCRFNDCASAPPYPGSAYPVPGAAPNRGAIEQELWAKSLPDGITHMPVAGYLYFPKPSVKTKNGAWELQYDGVAGRVKLALQNPPKR